jgi:hypothetical protein
VDRSHCAGSGRYRGRLKGPQKYII